VSLQAGSGVPQVDTGGIGHNADAGQNLGGGLRVQAAPVTQTQGRLSRPRVPFAPIAAWQGTSRAAPPDAGLVAPPQLSRNVDPPADATVLPDMYRQRG
jgi:hypothetical protein